MNIPEQPVSSGTPQEATWTKRLRARMPSVAVHDGYASATTERPSIPAKSLSRLTSVAPSASAQGEAALLASELDGGVKVARPFRDRFASQGSQAGLCQLRAPPRNLGNDAINPIQPCHPVLDSQAAPSSNR